MGRDKPPTKPQKKDASSKNNKKEDVNTQDGCCIPHIECLKTEDPLPKSLAEGVKFDCTNSDCTYAKQFAHPDCFYALEENLLQLLTSHGDARGWPQERITYAFKRVWGRKGLLLLQRSLKCKCGKGNMTRNEVAWEEREKIVEPQPDKKDKKKTKTKALPVLNHVGVPHELDNHYLSSRSPPRSDFIEDKYAPPPKAPKRIRRETDTSITSSNDYRNIKKPAHVPIGFAPIKVKPPIQPQLSVDETPPPKVDHHEEAKRPPDQPKAWQTVDRHRIEPKSVDYTVETDKIERRRVESECMSLSEKSIAEELVPKRNVNAWRQPLKINDENMKCSPLLSAFQSGPRNVSKCVSVFKLPSRLIDMAVQTDESSFPPPHRYDPTLYSNSNNKTTAACVQTDEYSFPDTPGMPPLHYDSGINSTACSPVTLARESYFQPLSLTDCPPGFNRNAPPGFSFGRYLDNLSIDEKKKSSYAAAPEALTPIFSGPQISFLFSDGSFAIEVTQNGKREKIKNAFGNDWTPLYLSMAEKTIEIGENAKNHYQSFPKHVVYDIMKIIGKRINEIAINPQWGFQLVNVNDVTYFQIEARNENGAARLTQEIVMAAFFAKMKAQVESHLNTEIKECLILTDFKLTESQKLIFNKAASKLNLEVVYPF